MLGLIDQSAVLVNTCSAKKITDMARSKELRLGVGTPDGYRSTIWKFNIHKSEIYILSRMFGSDSKVSLHSSGQCQWSRTGQWVKKDPNRRNAERHIMKWLAPRPYGSAANLIFRIRIPETELRIVDIDEDLTEVLWLPVPSRGQTASFACYITPPSLIDPTSSAQLPGVIVLSQALEDGHWFTVFHHIEALDERDLAPLRANMNEQARRTGIAPNPKHRGVALFITDDGASGFIEMCAIET